MYPTSVAIRVYFLALAVALLPHSASAQDEIRIGEFVSLTGGSAAFGASSHRGTALAVEQINASSGINGKSLKLFTEDDQSQTDSVAPAVRKLIAEDKVLAVLGEVASTRSLEAAPICQEARVPMISPASTNARVTRMGDYIFRACFIDPFQGTVMAKFAHESHLKRIAILNDTSQDYSIGLTQSFRESFTKEGGVITAEQVYRTSDREFAKQLTAILESRPEAIFLPGYDNEVALIANQMKAMNISIRLFGGDGWNGKSLLMAAGPALEGACFSAHFSSEEKTEHAQAFIQEYAQKYGVRPDDIAALSYDATILLAEALKRTGGQGGQSLRDEIAKTKDFNGVTGTISMNAQRDPVKSAVVLTISNSQLVFLKRVTP
jgi:branched-chain amino acid transport system substrate-binding protein